MKTSCAASDDNFSKNMACFGVQHLEIFCDMNLNYQLTKYKELLLQCGAVIK